MFRKLLTFIAFVSLVWTTPGLADETLTLATREKALTNRFAEQVLTLAYERLDIKVEYIRFPGARSVLEADKGNADGEVARLEKVLDRYKNLLIIPVPIFHSELTAYVHADSETIDASSWQSLKQYTVATVRGFKLVENSLAGSGLVSVPTSANAIKMLDKKRVDAVVLNRVLAQLAIKETGVKRVKEILPPLERLPVFHFLNKKNAGLVPRLSAVLKEMQQNGILNDMWNDFVSRETKKSLN